MVINRILYDSLIYYLEVYFVFTHYLNEKLRPLFSNDCTGLLKMTVHLQYLDE